MFVFGTWRRLPACEISGNAKQPVEVWEIGLRVPPLARPTAQLLRRFPLLDEPDEPAVAPTSFLNRLLVQRHSLILGLCSRAMTPNLRCVAPLEGRQDAYPTSSSDTALRRLG